MQCLNSRANVPGQLDRAWPWLASFRTNLRAFGTTLRRSMMTDSNANRSAIRTQPMESGWNKNRAVLGCLLRADTSMRETHTLEEFWNGSVTRCGGVRGAERGTWKNTAK